jgi:predicted short-subunit dehydrogenase-like oxidoreductase (DUF2520 family)
MPPSSQSRSQPFFPGIAIVGMGRWGSSLHAALVAAGMPPAVIIAGKRDLPQARLNAGLIWLCVPDTALARVAEAIARQNGSLRGQVMVHSSGVCAGEILTAAREAGAKTGSIHPLMTFPTHRPVPLSNLPFAIEGDRGIVPRLEKLVRALGGKPFRIPSAGKPLYHAAAVMASPLLLSLATAIEETATLAGLSAHHASQLIEPIMTTTLSNFFRKGPAKSFSGPFARGDANTVSLHLSALQGHPSLQHIYRALAEHALRVLPVQQEADLHKALAQLAPPILGKRMKTRRRTQKDAL